MSEATVLLELPVAVYESLEALAQAEQHDLVTMITRMLEFARKYPEQIFESSEKFDLATLLLNGPTLTDEELAEYDRIREWMSEWKAPEF